MSKESPKLDLSSMSVEEAIDALNAQFGANTLVIASRAKGVRLKHTSTGAYALDIALGGGWCENRIHELRGPFSSFKSTIGLISIRNFQRKYEEGWGVYIDAEKSFDADYADRLGVDLDRLLLVNPDSGEQAVDAMNSVMQLSVAMFMVIDSIAALVPSAEVEGSMQQQFMGLQARLVNRAMRIATSRVKRSLYADDAPTTTVLALNQLREKIGVMFGDPEYAPGGRGKEFAYSTVVKLFASVAKANVISEEEIHNKIKRKVRYGQRVDFKVVKNKCGGPQHEEGDFIWYERAYSGNRRYSFNNAEALFHYGAFNDVIAWDANGYSYKTLRAKSESHFVKQLKANPSIGVELRREIILKMRPAVSRKAAMRTLKNA